MEVRATFGLPEVHNELLDYDVLGVEVQVLVSAWVFNVSINIVVFSAVTISKVSNPNRVVLLPKPKSCFKTSIECH